MINVKRLKKYCSEDLSLVENYEEAVVSPEPYDLHHRLEITDEGEVPASTLIENGLYLNRPACELIFLSHSEHSKMHNTGKQWCLGRCLTDETKQKISESRLGKHLSEETKNKISQKNKGQVPWMSGKHHSETTKEKLSLQSKDYIKGSHYYNNGVIEVRKFECPEGFVKGRLKRVLS